MSGVAACNISENNSNCQAFEIEKAELDDHQCKIHQNATPIHVRIKGKGFGTTYSSTIEVYHIKGDKQAKYCELKWTDKGSWEANSITRDETLASDKDYSFDAEVRRSVNASGLPDFVLSVRLDHVVEGHDHMLDLDVALA